MGFAQFVECNSGVEENKIIMKEIVEEELKKRKEGEEKRRRRTSSFKEKRRDEMGCLHPSLNRIRAQSTFDRKEMSFLTQTWNFSKGNDPMKFADEVLQK